MKTWLQMPLAELPFLRDLPEAERPLPRIDAELGRSVPGWLLRVAAVIATGAVLAVATRRAEMDPAFGWTVTVAAAAVMAFWPATGVANVTVVIGGFLIALDGHGPFDPIVFALIPLGYAAVRLAWWAERVSIVARVEVAALERGLGRWLAVTSATLALGAVAFALAGRPSAVALVAGGAAVVGLVWLVVAARRA